MDIFITSDNSEAIGYAADCLIAGHEGLDVFFNDTLFLQTGSAPLYNKVEADKRDIPIWQAEHLGGVIICFPGDLSLCLTTWGENDFGERLFEATAKYFRDRGMNTSIDNNDILVDGKKVMSWARATTVTGWVQTVAHYSVNSDVDLIKSICIKPMNKIPGALSEYDITAEDLWNMIQSEVLIDNGR